MKCAACGGVAHPATGCQYTENVITCGPCVRAFIDWICERGEGKFRVGPRGKGATYVEFPTGISASVGSTRARASTPGPPRSR